jgi:hypothetical protein
VRLERDSAALTPLRAASRLGFGRPIRGNRRWAYGRRQESSVRVWGGRQGQGRTRWGARVEYVLAYAQNLRPDRIPWSQCSRAADAAGGMIWLLTATLVAPQMTALASRK